uniref:Uncharacterized protein n=1 Tax=Cannabis sativa TaxID=3483 RepID=A0A803QQV6_CANSA
MVNTIRTLVAPSSSLNRHQDPWTEDPDTQVLVTTRMCMNTADVVNRTTTTGATSLATIVSQDDRSISVDLNSRPPSPWKDPPQAPPTKERILGGTP